MKKNFQKHLKNEMGMSLAELLASIVILSILLTFFLGMFINSSKVNVKSEAVIDATYVAQTHIENLYAISQQTAFSERIVSVISIGYNEVSAPSLTDTWHVFVYNDITDYTIRLKILNSGPEIDHDMTRSIIEVNKVNPDGTEILEAQMESILQWKEDPAP